MKKYIAMILTCSLLLALLSIPAGATNANYAKNASVNAQVPQVIESFENEGNLSFAQKQEVSATLCDLAEERFDISIISIDRIESDGTIVYEEKFNEDFSSFFTSWKTNDGTLFVHFVEGDLENIVQFKPDGSIYVDGNKVSFEITPDTNGNVSPMAGVRTRTQRTDPLGTNGTAYTGSEYVFNSTGKLDIGAFIGSTTISAIVTALSAGLSTWLAVTSGIVTTSVLFATAEWLKSKSDYYNRYASFQDIRRGHPGDAVNYHFRHNVYAYSERNYGGSVKLVETYYEIKEST